MGLDEFLGLGLVGMSYGIAQLSLASGFLAVFAAGLALQRVREAPRPAAKGPAGDATEPLNDKMASPLDHAGEMRDSVQGFNEQLERLAELVVVMILGAMLAYTRPLVAGWWFIPLTLLVLRPIEPAVLRSGS